MIKYFNNFCSTLSGLMSVARNCNNSKPHSWYLFSQRVTYNYVFAHIIKRNVTATSIFYRLLGVIFSARFTKFTRLVSWLQLRNKGILKFERNRPSRRRLNDEMVNVGNLTHKYCPYFRGLGATTEIVEEVLIPVRPTHRFFLGKCFYSR